MTNKHDRNMLNRYRKERQKNLLARPGAHSFVIVLDHLKPSFNVAKIFRSAEAFGATAVHLINIGAFDPAPAKGSFRKVPACFHDDFSSCHTLLKEQGYSFFLLAAVAEKPLYAVTLPQKSAFIFGHEEFGCQISSGDYPDISSLQIPQFGSVQSLNVSIAATIVMYEYCRQRH